MSDDTVVSLVGPARFSDPLTELLRSGARRLIEAAVSAEFEDYLSAFVLEKLPDGRQQVVRNGHLPERKVLTGVGVVDVRVPKARSRSGSPEPFRSSVAPPYVRRCASLDAAIPWLYLHGVSTGQMRQAIAALVGERGPLAGCRRTWSVGSSACERRENVGIAQVSVTHCQSPVRKGFRPAQPRCRSRQGTPRPEPPATLLRAPATTTCGARARVSTGCQSCGWSLRRPAARTPWECEPPGCVHCETTSLDGFGAR